MVSRRAPLAPLLVSLLLPACGGRGAGPAAAGAGTARGAVSLERVFGRTGPGEGFPVAGSLRRGEAVFLVGAERGFARVRRSSADGPEAWIPAGAFETDADRAEREKRTAASRGIDGVAASTGPSGTTVLLAPDWGAARWGTLADDESVQVLYAVHDFFAVRLARLQLAFVPARDLKLHGAPLPPEPGSAPSPPEATPASRSAPEPLPGSGSPATIPAAGFEVEPPASGPLETLPAGSEPPALKTRTEPRYPEAARRAGISGEVVLRLVVETDGSVSRLQLLAGAPFGLSEAAEEAVRKWTWFPARVGGRPVAVWKTVRVRFASASAAPPGGNVPGERPL